MSSTVQTIPFLKLLIGFIPVILTLSLLVRWSVNSKHAIYAVVRMLVQLLLVGYLLAYIFKSDSTWVVLAVLMVMVTASSWIALGSVKSHRRELFGKAVFSIAAGGGSVLLFVTQIVLELDPWYLPRYMVPLAGMIFANSMNAVSLAAERFFAEKERGVSYIESRRIALQAALIPFMNSLFAVGLVSIPGMMTGQILSGIAPPMAARYQIMVMCMVFGSAGISSAIFLMLVKNFQKRENEE
jgi:putative ABC transport system permease protein